MTWELQGAWLYKHEWFTLIFEIWELSKSTCCQSRSSGLKVSHSCYGLDKENTQRVILSFEEPQIQNQNKTNTGSVKMYAPKKCRSDKL